MFARHQIKKAANFFFYLICKQFSTKQIIVFVFKLKICKSSPVFTAVSSVVVEDFAMTIKVCRIKYFIKLISV